MRQTFFAFFSQCRCYCRIQKPAAFENFNFEIIYQNNMQTHCTMTFYFNKTSRNLSFFSQTLKMIQIFRMKKVTRMNDGSYEDKWKFSYKRFNSIENFKECFHACSTARIHPLTLNILFQMVSKNNFQFSNENIPQIDCYHKESIFWKIHMKIELIRVKTLEETLEVYEKKEKLKFVSPYCSHHLFQHWTLHHSTSWSSKNSQWNAQYISNKSISSPL